MNVLNQATGQLQQMISPARQDQGATAPAEQALPEEAGLARDVDRVAPAAAVGDAGADVGTQAAQRAPVDDIAVAAWEPAIGRSRAW
jgi:hypothetical protein